MATAKAMRQPRVGVTKALRDQQRRARETKEAPRLSEREAESAYREQFRDYCRGW